jgi:hypothetical protein
VDGLTAANAWSQAGLMAREDLTPGGRFAAALATPSISGAFWESRATTNGAATSTGSFPVNYPNTWLRLQRAGNVFTGYAGFDGQNWATLGSTTLSFGTNIYFGLVASGYTTNALTAAAFRDVAPVFNPGTNVALTVERHQQSSRKTSLVISEIMYHPTNSALEFVEIFNTRGEPQNMSGYKLGGSINYTFPQGTVIAGGGFLVVAKSPTDLETAYGLGTVLGPYSGSLPNDSGTVDLINQAGALFLEVDYSDSAPWPVSADGLGHSLVLVKPSYGENDPRAWAASDALGGSPGRLDPVTADPLRAVVINEVLAHGVTKTPFVEVHNTSAIPWDLSACVVSCDSSSNTFTPSPGTVIGAYGYLSWDAAQLGFAPDPTGDTIYIRDSARVLDVMRFGAQQTDVSYGRAPDGSSNFRALATPTPGTTNAAPLNVPIVINEIMYAPISLDDSDQYVELYNRSANAVNVSGWQFTAGISYTFPSNTVIAAGGYLVVARNTAQMMSHYSYLTTTTLAGTAREMW